MSAFRAQLPCKKQWAALSGILSVLLHILPLWIGSLSLDLDKPSILELELAQAHSLRERVWRELALEMEARHVAPVTTLPALDTPVEQHTRLSSARSAADMERARRVQQVIRSLWNTAHCPTAGYALVRLHILEDGRIGDYAVTRLRGAGEFRAFLLNFLQTVQGSYSQEAGPGEELMLECEFMVMGTGREKRS